MSLNWKKIAIGLGAAAGVIIIWLLLDKKSKENELTELKKKIQDNEDFDDQIKSKLKKLVDEHPDIESGIASELKSISELIEIKQETKAIATLAKIIENLLKVLYKNDQGVKEIAKKSGRKQPVFADYLEYAKEKNVISNEDFHLVSVLKIIRNEEAHELDVKKEKSKITAAFVSGIAIIISLYQLVKKTVQPESSKIQKEIFN